MISRHPAFANITLRVGDVATSSGIRESLCLVNSMHITSGMFGNDDESGLHDDFSRLPKDLAPHETTNAYAHNRIGEDNVDAHLKRQIMGREVVVAVADGRHDAGTW